MKRASRRLSLAVQYADEEGEPPPRRRIFACLRAALPMGGEVTVRFVDADESARLNREFRGKHSPADVLAFPYELHDGKPVGDIVICAPLAADSARRRREKSDSRHARILVHAAMHLLGHTHEGESDSAEMLQAELDALRLLGIHSALEN